MLSAQLQEFSSPHLNPKHPYHVLIFVIILTVPESAFIGLAPPLQAPKPSASMRSSPFRNLDIAVESIDSDLQQPKGNRPFKEAVRKNETGEFFEFDEIAKHILKSTATFAVACNPNCSK
jgi:hypothetical protein